MFGKFGKLTNFGTKCQEMSEFEKIRECKKDKYNKKYTYYNNKCRKILTNDDCKNMSDTKDPSQDLSELNISKYKVPNPKTSNTTCINPNLETLKTQVQYVF